MYNKHSVKKFIEWLWVDCKRECWYVIWTLLIVTLLATVVISFNSALDSDIVKQQESLQVAKVSQDYEVRLAILQVKYETTLTNNIQLSKEVTTLSLENVKLKEENYKMALLVKEKQMKIQVAEYINLSLKNNMADLKNDSAKLKEITDAVFN